MGSKMSQEEIEYHQHSKNVVAKPPHLSFVKPRPEVGNEEFKKNLNEQDPTKDDVNRGFWNRIITFNAKIPRNNIKCFPSLVECIYAALDHCKIKVSLQNLATNNVSTVPIDDVLSYLDPKDIEFESIINHIQGQTRIDDKLLRCYLLCVSIQFQVDCVCSCLDTSTQVITRIFDPLCEINIFIGKNGNLYEYQAALPVQLDEAMSS